MKPEEDLATFTISNVVLEHRGSYRCSYRPLSELFNISETSNDLKLLVLDPRLPRPTISISPSRLVVFGEQVTICCKTDDGPAKFYLHKDGDQTATWPMKSNFDEGHFPISDISWEHLTNYSCSYALSERPFLFSAPSDPVELLISETQTPDYTKINIICFTIGGLILLLLAYIMIRDTFFEGNMESRFLSSSGGNGHQRRLPAPSLDMKTTCRHCLSWLESTTIEFVCDSHLSAWTLHFYLEKDGQNIRNATNQVNGKVTFVITNLSRKHGGNYTCYYSDSELSLSYHSKSVKVLGQDHALPRPNISLSPSNVAFPGNNITIQCYGNYLSKKKFYLYHSDAYMVMKLEAESAMTHDAIATFTIFNVKMDNRGRYSCRYNPLSGFSISRLSNQVELFVVEHKFEKPTISLQPLEVVDLGGNITIHCRSKSKATVFYFQKSANPVPPLFMVTRRTKDNFLLINNASWQHRGSYQCSYSLSGNVYDLSEPSDPVELLIADPGLPRPNISLSPDRVAVLGSNITIQCWAKVPIQRFLLHNPRGQIMLYSMKPEEDQATFSISNVALEHGGSYRCSYRPLSELFVISQTSNDMKLFVLGPSLPRPAISISPSGLVALGGQVTIHCQCEDGPVNFYLIKAGDPTAMWPMRFDGHNGGVSIRNLSLEHLGYYHCSYAFLERPFQISEFSDPVELLVSDADLARPNISQSPRGPIPPGENVTFQCQGQGRRFSLYKHGDQIALQSVEVSGDKVEFLLNNVSKEDGGIYSCRYNLLDPYVFSKSSNILELQVLDLSLPRPVISISPHGSVTFGGQVDFHCESQDGPAKFYLHQAGNTRPKWSMEADFDEGNLSFRNVGWEHEGNYSCSYALLESPFLFSAPSDPLKLLISDYTQINTIRFAIGILILLLLFLLTYIVIRDQHFRQEHGLKFSRHLSEGEDRLLILNSGGNAVLRKTLPAPSIYIYNDGILLGRNTTILCRSHFLWMGRDFYLEKDGQNVRNATNQVSREVTFVITNVSREDGGVYSCYYSDSSLFWSNRSKLVELLIIDPSLPTPSISLRSIEMLALGENITFHCESPVETTEFLLQKAGDQMTQQLIYTNETTATFTIRNASREQGGLFGCMYRAYSSDFLFSQPSAAKELLILDPDLPRPNISLSPNRVAVLGSNVTIQCWAKGPIQRFFLHQPGGQITSHSVEPEGDMLNFTISNVVLEHRGSYRCSYRPLSEFLVTSETSYDDVKLFVLDPSLPRPAISISPSGSVALGGQVQFRCEIQDGPAKFYLHKDGDQTAERPMRSDYDVGEFSISNISWEHQGNYSCSYTFLERNRILPLFSAPSDPLELLVLETDYTQGNIIRFSIGGLILLLLAYTMILDQSF
ncbi:immunoglobulin superfamily member 1-like [Hemicordylus capensis]|uniref:immunoglobulin superfamily member 1-like n=1 Tax=Hemicordylus capensis TaxID=884348 RepID=UPI0023025D3F|nr:immunoglobulin superfamily member 1-like [Hemicordylus capensis]